MPVLITELLDRADTGVSVKPFFCKTDSNREIYVKPAGALAESLIAEWIGGRLAQLMGLPCPDIDIVEVLKQLSDANRNPDWSDFKPGIGFGSYYLGATFRDLQSSDLRHLNVVELSEAYLFDYWIKNEDRKMGPTAGNPNTLVHYDRDEFCLIDHDNAFDPEFSLSQFLQLHIGRQGKELWLLEATRQRWSEKAAAALSELDDIWRELPEEWVYSNLDNPDEARYTINRYRSILELPFTDTESFWQPLLS